MRAIAAPIVVITGVLLAAACGSSGTAAPTTTTTSGLSLASPRVQQIALARTSNDLFSIFPASPGKKNCAIPEGGVHQKPGTLAGICATSIRREDSHEPALIVTFTETWTFACPPGAFCPLRRPLSHRWQVIEGEPVVTSTSRLRVLGTRESGAPAPQSYK